MQQFSTQELIKKGMSDTPTGQKVGKVIMGTVIVGIIMAALYVALPYILPIFQDIEAIASSILRTAIYVCIGVALFILVKKQIRNFDYFTDYLARQVFKGIITYDPFLIQEKQILQAEHDVEKMMQEKAIIDGKYVELHTKLEDYNNKFQAAGLTVQDLTTKAQKTTDPKVLQLIKLDIDDSIRKQVSCKKYIDSISPIANDMKYMTEFISDGYQILKRRIKGAKEDLNINKDIFESAHAGASALERMKRAMVGDIELNSDAEKAQLAVMQNIALTVGQMKVSMEIISDVTRSANIEEGGQLALARKQLEQLNLSAGDSIPVGNISANFQNMPTLQQVQILKPSSEMPD